MRTDPSPKFDFVIVSFDVIKNITVDNIFQDLFNGI